MLFAGAGHEVRLFDVEQSQVESALKNIKEEMTKLEARGMLKGKLSAEEQYKLIKSTSNLKECIEGVIHVQVHVYCS